MHARWNIEDRAENGDGCNRVAFINQITSFGEIQFFQLTGLQQQEYHLVLIDRQ